MPHNIKDGDNVVGNSLVILRQIVKVEVDVREVTKAATKVLILTKELHRMLHLMRHVCTLIQNLDEQIILLLSQVS